MFGSRNLLPDGLALLQDSPFGAPRLLQNSPFTASKMLQNNIIPAPWAAPIGSSPHPLLTYRDSCGDAEQGEGMHLIATCALQLLAICLVLCGQQEILGGSA